MDRTKQKPTPEQTAAYQGMFDYLNRVLFGGSLPSVILNFSRHARAYGFFAPERWGDGGGAVTHEISLNPKHLRRPPRAVAATLAHEMVHLWQHVAGKPSRRGYHNHEWADMMQAIGLAPSSTGEPGGKRVGQGMSHYIEEGGAFDLAFKAMPADLLLPWQCSEAGTGGGKPAPRSKVLYRCPKCSLRMWGKPGAEPVCGPCEAPTAPRLIEEGATKPAERVAA